MEPKPDTNTDFDYPPLTAEQFAQVFAFYQHDDTKVTASNGVVYTVSVNFPLEPEWVFKHIGFRVKISLDDQRKSKTFFAISHANDTNALGLIKSFVERVAHSPA